MNEKWVADEIMALKKSGVATHASTHGNSGADRVTLDTSQITSGTLDAARMPIATTSTVGAVKAGTGLSVASDGTLSATASGATWGSITGTLSDQTDLNTALSGKAASSHSHAASDITSGQLAIARIPTGSTSSTVCVGDDSRLSDARTPTSHSHSYSDLPTASTSSRGCVQVGSGLSISNGVLSASSGGFNTLTMTTGTTGTKYIGECFQRIYGYGSSTSGYSTCPFSTLIPTQINPVTVNITVYYPSSDYNLFEYCSSVGSSYTTVKSVKGLNTLSVSCVSLAVNAGAKFDSATYT